MLDFFLESSHCTFINPNFINLLIDSQTTANV